MSQDSIPPEVEEELFSRFKAAQESGVISADESFIIRRANGLVNKESNEYYCVTKNEHLIITIGSVVFENGEIVERTPTQERGLF